MNEPSFVDPYASCTEEELVRLQSFIKSEDYDYIRSICPDKGTIQIVVNTLWHRFCLAVKKQKINQIAHKHEFQQCVNNIVIEVSGGVKPSGGTTNRPARKTSRGV